MPCLEDVDKVDLLLLFAVTEGSAKSALAANGVVVESLGILCCVLLVEDVVFGIDA